ARTVANVLQNLTGLGPHLPAMTLQAGNLWRRELGKHLRTARLQDRIGQEAPARILCRRPALHSNYTLAGPPQVRRIQPRRAASASVSVSACGGSECHCTPRAVIPTPCPSPGERSETAPRACAARYWEPTATTLPVRADPRETAV